MRERILYNEDAAGSILAISKLFDIPQYVLRHWQLAGFISRSVITMAEWEALDLIRCCIWDNRNVIRAMLRNLPASERRRIVDTCQKTTLERIVYNDMLRFKLSGIGIMGNGRQVTYQRYESYLTWRHPNLYHLLTRKIFEKQRKAALAKISYARKTASIVQLRNDLLYRKAASKETSE